MSHGCSMHPIDLHLSQADNIHHRLHIREKVQNSLEQDLKALIHLLKREQQFILIWLGSGCLWSHSEARNSLQMLWMISYVVCILHLVRTS